MAHWQDPETMSFWVLGVSLIILFLIVYVLVFVKNHVARIIRENQLKAELELNTQKELLRHTLVVQEEERSRIAMDLHDNLVAELNIIRMLNENEEDRKAINMRLKQSMASARKISHELTPPMMQELDMNELLEEYVDSLNVGINVRFYCFHQATMIRLPQIKLHLFRIFQEVIANSLKHANASSVEVHFRSAGSVVGMLIRDNGNGASINGGNGLGLKNIESRAQLLKANYRYNSRTNEGTSFLLCFNLNMLNE